MVLNWLNITVKNTITDGAGVHAQDMRTLLMKAGSVLKLLLVCVGALFVSITAQANDTVVGTPKTKIFPSVVETTIKRGRHRSMGEINVLAPFKQQSDKMHFINYIGKRSNMGGAEFNLGYGTRTIRNNAVHGYYGFFDVRRTPSTNTFYQLTLGTEKFSKDLDWRVNTYIPLSSKKAIPNSARKKSIVESSGGGLSVVSDHFEYPMGGMDFEIGKKFDTKGGSLGIWGGAYYFGHRAVKNIYGPMVRMELSQSLNTLALNTLATDAHIKFGLQYQDDQVRGKNFISNLSLRMDLYNTPSANKMDKKTRKTLSYLQRRMLDPVIRDVDIVTNRDQITETPNSNVTGRQLKKVVRVKKGSELYNSTNNGEEDSLVVIENDIETSLEIRPKAGQVLVSGSQKIVITTDSGVVMTLQASNGAQKKVSAKINNQQVVQNMSGAFITGVQVQNKTADGRLVTARADLPVRIIQQIEKDTTYDFFKNSKGYTYAKMCEPGVNGANCRNNISVNPNTGAVTISNAAEVLSILAVIATDSDGNPHQVMLRLNTANAQALADQQQQATLPNDETYKGIRLLYGNDFKCTKDAGVYGQNTGANACGSVGTTKIQYVKNVIDRYLDTSTNPYAARIITSLQKNKATMTLYNKTADKRSTDVMRTLLGNSQDLQATETFATAGNTRGGMGANGVRNAALEEIIHLIQNYGIDYAMPDWHERLNDATEQARVDGKLSWVDVKNADDEDTPDGSSDDDDALPRRDLDDEYFADAVEAYFNMRGGTGYIKDNTVCSSGSTEAGVRNCATAGTTARDELRTNHKSIYDLIEEMFGPRSTFF